jgi:hypothetical protein
MTTVREAASAAAINKSKARGDDVADVRALLAEARAVQDACRRDHYGTECEWLEFALGDLETVARRFVAAIPGVEGVLAGPRRVAAVARADIARVIAIAGALKLPIEACSGLHLPEEQAATFRAATSLLARALELVTGRCADALPRELYDDARAAVQSARFAVVREGAPPPRPRAVAPPAALVARGPAFGSLDEALAAAQERARPLAKDGRTEKGDSFTSASAVHAHARECLAFAGLYLTVEVSELARLGPEPGSTVIRRVYVLRHPATKEWRAITQHWPLGSDHPAAATTSATKRAFMDVLMLTTREGEEDEGSAAREVRDTLRLLPPAFAWPVEDALARALGNREQVRNLVAFARDLKPALLGPSPSAPAPSPASVESVVSGDFLDGATPAATAAAESAHGAPSPAVELSVAPPREPAPTSAPGASEVPASGEQATAPAAGMVSAAQEPEPVLVDAGSPPSPAGAEVPAPSAPAVARTATGVEAPSDPAPAPPPVETPAPASALEADVERLKAREAEAAASAAKPSLPPIREAASSALRRTRARGSKAPPPDREERATDPTIVVNSLEALPGEWKE